MGAEQSNNLSVAVSDIIKSTDARLIDNKVRSMKFKTESINNLKSITLWPERFTPGYPAYINHPNYGACLLIARRRSKNLLAASKTEYLVELLDPFSDRTLRRNRIFYVVPESIQVQPEITHQFILPVKRIIVKFIYNSSFPSKSILNIAIASDINTRNNANSYEYSETGEQMELKEFNERQRLDVDNREGYRMAWSILLQDYPDRVQGLDLGRLYLNNPQSSVGSSIKVSSSLLLRDEKALSSISSHIKPSALSVKCSSEEEHKLIGETFMRATTIGGTTPYTKIGALDTFDTAFSSPSSGSMKPVYNPLTQSTEFVREGTACLSTFVGTNPIWYRKLCDLPESNLVPLRSQPSPFGIGSQLKDTKRSIKVKIPKRENLNFINSINSHISKTSI